MCGEGEGGGGERYTLGGEVGWIYVEWVFGDRCGGRHRWVEIAWGGDGCGVEIGKQSKLNMKLSRGMFNKVKNGVMMSLPYPKSCGILV